MPNPTQHTQRWYYADPPPLPPTGSVRMIVDAGDAASHLRIADVQSDPTDLELLIQAATDYAEDAMSIVLLAKTIVATFYGREPIILPRGPLIAIESITNAAGDAVSTFQTRTFGHQVEVIVPDATPRPLTVTYRAGYADPNRIPAAIRLAILAHVGTLYEARESTTDKPRTAVPHSLDAFYRMKNRGTGVG